MKPPKFISNANKIMNYDVCFFLIAALISTCYGTTFTSFSSIHDHKLTSTSHRPTDTAALISKRVEIAHKSEYSSGRVIRRQNVIRPLEDEEKIKKSDVDSSDGDDIESLGTSIDATGKILKMKESKHAVNASHVQKKAERASTRELIERIKEIQNKIFKRTGSKALAKKLKEMSPDALLVDGDESEYEKDAEKKDENKESTKADKKSEKAINDESDKKTKNDSEKKSTKKNSAANTGKEKSSEKTSEKFLEKSTEKLSEKENSKESKSDKSNSNTKSKESDKKEEKTEKNERRKIIPEEVVDKILEKFQQLREEAKNMAMLETKHDVETKIGGAEVKEVHDEEKKPAVENNNQSRKESDPYATLEKIHDNTELKNLTLNKADITAVGINPNSEKPPPGTGQTDPEQERANMLQQLNPGPGVDSPTAIETSMAQTMAGDNLEQNRQERQDSQGNLPNSAVSAPVVSAGLNTPVTGPTSFQGKLPMMFIKTGQMLVPVFSGQLQQAGMTTTGAGMAQMSAAPGYATPQNMPENQFSYNQQQVNSGLISQQSGPETPVSRSDQHRPPPKAAVPFSHQFRVVTTQPFPQQQRMSQAMGSVSQQNGGMPQQMMGGVPQQSFIAPQPGQIIPQAGQPVGNLVSSSTLFQSAPGPQGSIYTDSGVSSRNAMGSSHSEEIPNDEGFSDQMPTVDQYPSTKSLVDEILHAPGFPQLAARLMSESSTMKSWYDGNNDHHQRSEGPSKFMQGLPSRNGGLYGMEKGDVSFGMQQNFAAGDPNTPNMLSRNSLSPQQYINSMMQQQQFQQQQLQMNGGSPLTHGRSQSNSLLSSNPYQESRVNMGSDAEFNREQQLFNPKNMATNDISDPLPNEMEGQGAGFNTFQNQNPDQLLDYAKYKSFEKNFINPAEQSGAARSRVSPPDVVQSQSNSQPWNSNPSALLDKIHQDQLKGELMGAGDPSWMKRRPVNEDMPPAGNVNFKKLNSGSPEALLELLNKDNNNMFRDRSSGDREEDRLMQNFHRQKPRYEQAIARRKVPKWGDPDPSVADQIGGQIGGQTFDIEDKSLATEYNGDSPFYGKRSKGRPGNQVSVVPDDLLQLHHGRMSMDSANVISHFFKDPQYRSSIPGSLHSQAKRTQLTNKNKNKENGTVVEVLQKNLVDDDIELEVNGKKMVDRANVRSTIRNAGHGGKYMNGHGRTIKSKGPIQIELSHDSHAHKIVNIITNSKFNVTSERKRNNIPRDTIPKHQLPQIMEKLNK